MKKINESDITKDQMVDLKRYCKGYFYAALTWNNGRKLDYHENICNFFTNIFYGKSDKSFQERMDFTERFRDISEPMTANLDKCFGSNFDFDNPSNERLSSAIDDMVKKFIKFAFDAYR